MQKLTRDFYTRHTLDVARALLGKYLVHQLPSGQHVRGKIVDTEAYAGLYDPGSHTYHKKQKTERTQIWYEDGGYAYVYAIYGSYVCLGITTEQQGTPGAVLIRALELTDEMIPLLAKNVWRKSEEEKPELLCSGPSKLCIAMHIDTHCNGLDLCGDELYLEDAGEVLPIENIVFGPRINIDYAGAGALSAWRYSDRQSRAISKKSYEPLRDWRVKGYPSLHQQRPLDLFAHLMLREEQATMDEEGKKQLQVLPKVELHLHLEGCVTPATLRALCQKNHKPLPNDSQENDTFGTFDEFVYAYHRICQSLLHEEDFALIIADIADYLKRNTILYAEISWTPFLYLNRGLRFEAIMDVMNEALEVHGIADRVNFLIDIQRDHGVDAGTWVYQHVFAARDDLHIVGVGLTGQEEGFPPIPYQALYHKAQERGLGITAHAGEYGSTEDIWQCIHMLGVRRIGHGIRAVEDRDLLEYLAAQHIHLDISLTSNIRLERVMTYSGHPLQTLWKRGIHLGLNADDPGLFASDLSDEYRKAMEHCRFSLHDLWQSLQYSIQAAFLPPERKYVLQQHIDHHWRGICLSV